MNTVIIMGNLTRDPEVRYSQGENSTAIARYTLAVPRPKRKDGTSDDQKADFIQCVSFGKRAEFAEKYLHKGDRIIVVGKWQTGSYTNKDGQKVYTNECVVDTHDFCGGKQNAAGESSVSGEQISMASDGFMNIPDDVEDEGLPLN